MYCVYMRNEKVLKLNVRHFDLILGSHFQKITYHNDLRMFAADIRRNTYSLNFGMQVNRQSYLKI